MDLLVVAASLTAALWHEEGEGERRELFSLDIACYLLVIRITTQ